MASIKIKFRASTVADHEGTIYACKFGEGRHPAVAHLIGHLEEGVQYGFFAIAVDEDTKRMSGAVGVPYPVVGIERDAVVAVYQAVEGAEIAIVLAEHIGRSKVRYSDV